MTTEKKEEPTQAKDPYQLLQETLSDAVNTYQKEVYDANVKYQQLCQQAYMMYNAASSGTPGGFSPPNNTQLHSMLNQSKPEDPAMQKIADALVEKVLEKMGKMTSGTDPEALVREALNEVQS